MSVNDKNCGYDVGNVLPDIVRSLSSLTTPSEIVMEVENHVRVAMVFSKLQGPRRQATETEG